MDAEMQDWRDWANTPRDKRTPRTEAELPIKLYKRPRVGMVLAGATGPELVIKVGQRGLQLVVQDRNNRFFHISRAPLGIWTIYPTLRDYSTKEA